MGLAPVIQRPRFRDDVVVRRMSNRHETYVIVKDPVELSYFKFEPWEEDVLKLLDGTRDYETLASEFDAVVVGPGMTVAHGAVLVARSLFRDIKAPLVLDADGLNAMVDAAETLMLRSAPTVITPHPGEMARLLAIRSHRPWALWPDRST